jgi:hypothetical protein
MNRLGAPGFIRDIEIQDEVSGHSISLHVGRLFTRLSVDGRDYFFPRLSGHLDGTGSGCS